VPQPAGGSQVVTKKKTTPKKTPEDSKKKPVSASKGKKEVKETRKPNKASKDYLSQSAKKEKSSHIKETHSSSKKRKKETVKKADIIDSDITIEDPKHNIPTTLPSKTETKIPISEKEEEKVLGVESISKEDKDVVKKTNEPSIFILAADNIGSECNTLTQQEIRRTQRFSTNIELKPSSTPSPYDSGKSSENATPISVKEDTEKGPSTFELAKESISHVNEQKELQNEDEENEENEENKKVEEEVVKIESTKEQDEANIKTDEDEDEEPKTEEYTTEDQTKEEIDLSIRILNEDLKEEVKEDIKEVDTSPLKANELLDLSDSGSDSVVDDAAAFGMEYFFGEDAVPKEVASLANNLNAYTDELVEAKRRNSNLNIQSKLQLDEIKEEAADYNSPSVDVDTPDKHFKGLFAPAPDIVIPEVKEEIPMEAPRQSINPISFIPRASESTSLVKKPDAKFNPRATFGNTAGFLDMKTLCRSLSYALRQHILFSRGKKTFFELQKEGNTRFTYKLGKVLTIDLNEEENKEKPKAPLNIDKSKDIISESLSAVVGSRVSRDLVNSYLTTEDNEDDLQYSDSDIEEVFGENAEDFINSYRNSITTLRASEVVRKSLFKSMGNKVPIRGFSDVNKFIDNRVTLLHRKISSGSVELGDLHATPTSGKGYSSPKKIGNPEMLKKSPSEAVPDNVFEVTHEPNIAEKTLAEDIQNFSVFQLNYDFESDEYIDLEVIPEEFLITPSEKDIYKFCKKVVVYSKMEKEIPIIALIYVEKLILKTGLLMNELNWRRFIFTALVIASKVLPLYI